MRRADLMLSGWVLPALLVAALLVRPQPLDAEAGREVLPPAATLRDTGADEARTIPAYREASDPRRTVRLFSVRFWAQAGERRWVSARVVARQPGSTPDPLIMAAISVTCSPGYDGVVSAGATQNLLRGSTSAFTPRFVYGVSRTGMVACVVNATGLRPRPSSSGYRSANVWRVDAGSFLAVSEPIQGWSRSIATAARSRVLDRGEAWTPIRRTVRVGTVPSFRLFSDHKLTTCSAVGGSQDPTSLGRDLCAGRVSRRGSMLRLVVRVVQLNAAGRPCAPPQLVARRRARIGADVHHRMLFAGGTVEVSRSGACRPAFNVFGTLTQLGGADVVVHATSEVTSVVADDRGLGG